MESASVAIVGAPSHLAMRRQDPPWYMRLKGPSMRNGGTEELTMSLEFINNDYSNLLVAVKDRPATFFEMWHKYLAEGGNPQLESSMRLVEGSQGHKGATYIWKRSNLGLFEVQLEQIDGDSVLYSIRAIDSVETRSIGTEVGTISFRVRPTEGSTQGRLSIDVCTTGSMRRLPVFEKAHEEDLRNVALLCLGSGGLYCWLFCTIGEDGHGDEGARRRAFRQLQEKAWEFFANVSPETFRSPEIYDAEALRGQNILVAEVFPSATEPQEDDSEKGFIAHLKELAELHKSGELSDDEYITIKAKLIAQMSQRKL